LHSISGVRFANTLKKTFFELLVDFPYNAAKERVSSGAFH
jgi:hypothetical protein